MSPRTSSALVSRLVGGPIAVCLAAVCSPVFAFEPSPCVPTGESVASPSNQASQVVSVNPDTGELVRAEIPPEAALPEQERRTVVFRRHPDGTVSADVGDRFKAHLVAQIVDGKLVTCHAQPELNHPHQETDTREKLDE